MNVHFYMNDFRDLLLVLLRLESPCIGKHHFSIFRFSLHKSEVACIAVGVSLGPGSSH